MKAFYTLKKIGNNTYLYRVEKTGKKRRDILLGNSEIILSRGVIIDELMKKKASSLAVKALEC